MNIDEIRAARIAAELEILDVIRRFNELTSCRIDHCHLETVTFCSVEDSRRFEVPAYVRLTVESI